MTEAFNRQLLQSRIEVQEATFSSLGKELHDNIGQLLGTAKMLIGVSQRNLSASADTIRTADETLSKAIQELRGLSKTLNKEWLEQFDFRENLAMAAQRLNQTGSVEIEVNDHINRICLNAEQQIILFRIVQEAIQNAIKHGNATRVAVDLRETHGWLHIAVSDNGRGFIKNTDHVPGVGMMNMKQRAALLEGEVSWNSDLNGTTVAIRTPCQTFRA